jgi:beta-lactam-binding protein with PASTA domain
VKVYVSMGKSTVLVPSVSGLSLEAAEAAITSRKLEVGTVAKKDSPNIAADIVVGTTPPENVEASEGDSIDIAVSTGMVGVPDFVGTSASSAGTKIVELELSVTVKSNTGCSGRSVTSQSLEPGSYPQHSAITIEVCTG